MKKMVKLLIGCLFLLIMLCIISACAVYFFWDSIRSFVSPYIGKGNSENISINYSERIDEKFKLRAIW